MQEQQQQTISKYDRKRGALEKVALWAKPATIQNVEPITGQAETFVVATARYDSPNPGEGGDYIFLECNDGRELIRVYLPPRVAGTIARQRESLGKRNRKLAARKLADERKAAGWKPDFTKKKKPADSSAGIA